MSAICARMTSTTAVVMKYAPPPMAANAIRTSARQPQQPPAIQKTGLRPFFGGGAPSPIEATTAGRDATRGGSGGGPPAAEGGGGGGGAAERGGGGAAERGGSGGGPPAGAPGGGVAARGG